ncbi:MAG: photosystem II stability/assembly factor-like uncharacterized protein [Lentimonas sp.]|jgi:photosystem II stability/assembly factor-like uncharacterized protein
MYSFRYSACILASVFCSILAEAQSSSLLPVDGNFRALTQSDTRIFGLDFSGGIWSSENGGVSFSERYEIVGDFDDTYYTIYALGDTVMAAGTDALMVRSGDDGDSWDASVNADYVLGDLKGVAGRAVTSAENQWVAVGNEGNKGVIFSSQDDGLGWARYESGVNFLNFDFTGVVWTGSAWLVCGLKTQIEAGSTDYSGVIYRSLDASSWTLIGDSFAAPLRALAADDGGNVLVVGESGIILRSTDDGQSFVRIDGGALSEDLSAVVAAGADHFVIGGDGKSVFAANAGVVSVLHAAAGSAPRVAALLVSGGDVLLGGEFTSSQRTVPFGLELQTIGNFYRLTVDEALSGKVYTLETSTTLDGWDSVSVPSQAGFDGPLSWNIPADGDRRFWRVTEF